MPITTAAIWQPWPTLFPSEESQLLLCRHSSNPVVLWLMQHYLRHVPCHTYRKGPCLWVNSKLEIEIPPLLRRFFLTLTIFCLVNSMLQSLMHQKVEEFAMLKEKQFLIKERLRYYHSIPLGMGPRYLIQPESQNKVKLQAESFKNKNCRALHFNSLSCIWSCNFVIFIIKFKPRHGPEVPKFIFMTVS